MVQVLIILAIMWLVSEMWTGPDDKGRPKQPSVFFWNHPGNPKRKE